MVKRKGAYIIILAAILIFSSVLTFYHLDKRGLLDWDEASFISVVKTWRAGSDWVIGRLFYPQSLRGASFTEFVLERGCAVNTTAKDGFIGIVYLFSYFLGVKDISILIVSGVFGLLTAWLVFLLGSKVFGTPAGLFAALFLVISEFHLHYSRSGFAQTTSVFFLYLAAFFYIKSCQEEKNNSGRSGRTIFFSGLALGYAFTCHYSLIWAIPSFFLFEIIAKALFLRELRFGIFLRRLLLLSCGVLIPLFFWGGLSEAAKLVLYSNPLARRAIEGASGSGEFVSYFSRISQFLAIFSPAPASQAGLSIPGHCDPLFYVKLMLRWEGGLFCFLLSCGIIYFACRLALRRNFFEFIVLSLFLIPFFYWSFYSWQLSRSFIAAIPAVSLIISGLISALWARLRLNMFHKTAFIIFIISLALWRAGINSKREFDYRSGFPEAVKYMRAHGGVKHLTSEFTISRFLVGRKNALDISVSFEGVDAGVKLGELYQKGYRYLVLDQMRFAFKDSALVKAAENAKPVFSVFHSTGANIFENNLPGFREWVLAHPKVVEVYDLTEIAKFVK